MDAILLALGASRRREILGLLRCGERSAGEIYRALGDVTFGAVSQHLGVLERAGLVQVRREGRSRLYLARPEGLGPLREWLAQWKGVAPNQVLTGNGSLQIVEFLCFAILKPGDIVVKVIEPDVPDGKTIITK